MNWIQLAQDMDLLLSYLNTVKHFWDPQKENNILNTTAITGLTRRNLLVKTHDFSIHL
jgi:hypothetical protein